jgi:hypothetical protein
MAENDTTTGTTTVTSGTPYFDPAPELTQDEYQSRFIDFYNMPTITDPVVIDDDDDDDDDDQDVQANVLAPVGSDEDRPTVFGAGVTLGGESSFDFKTKDFNEVINDYVDPSKAIQDGAKKDKSLSGFGKAVADMYKTPEGAVGSAVGTMMGLGPLGGPALSAMAEMNRKKQKETADSIAATGGSGGSMFELNGQLVYRKPGETIFSGVFSGTQRQMAGLEHMSKGFLPGMMKEIANSRPDAVGTYINTGHKALATASGVAVDAYGTVVGSDGSSQNVSATQATKARNRFTTDLMTEMGYTASQISAATAGKRDLSQQLKQALNEHMKQFKTGIFHKTSNVALGDYNKHLEEAKKFSSDFLKSKLGDASSEKKQKPGVDPASVLANEGPDKGNVSGDFGMSDFSGPPKEDSKSEEKSGGTQSGGTQSGATGGGTAPGGSGGSYGGMGGSNVGGSGGYRALGGRVGYAPGGVARAAPAGFVERPPSQVSEAATVADDKPMSVDDGTFVINAAAVEFAGEDDIARMLQTAYKKLGKQGKGAPSKEQIDIAVSRGEVIVPPAIAKIIGYDRLEKINNRGKKETSKRIKENGQQPVGAAGGGFLTRKKLADGGEVDEYEDKIIADEVHRKMNELLTNAQTFTDAQVMRDKDFKLSVDSDYYSGADLEYANEVARLNKTNPILGDFYAGSSNINVPLTPTLFNLFVLAEEIAHLDAEKFANIGNSFGYEESDLREELRAKDIAFKVVGGMFPTDEKTANMTRDGYLSQFRRYLQDNAEPVIQQAMYKKYPELKAAEPIKYPSQKFDDAVDKQRKNEVLERIAKSDERLAERVAARYREEFRSKEIN